LRSPGPRGLGRRGAAAWRRRASAEPVALIHQDWVGERIGRLTGALTKFRNAPGALTACLLGAIVVQAVLVAFYAAIVHSMSIPASAWHLAVIVPISFVVQMARCR